MVFDDVNKNECADFNSKHIYIETELFVFSEEGTSERNLYQYDIQRPVIVVT